MDIIIFNILRFICIAMFICSAIVISLGLNELRKMSENGNGVIKNEVLKDYRTIKFYGVIVPFIAMIISIIIAIPVILIELNT